MTANTNFSDFNSQVELVIAANHLETDRLKKCVLLESYVDLVDEAITFDPSKFALWKKITIMKAMDWQQEPDCTYELWLRCEEFLVKYANRCMIPTKRCSIKTLKGKMCRKYSMKGSNACYSHGGK